MPIIEISSLSHPGVEIFSTLTEAQLRNRIEPTKGIFIAESPKVISVAIDAGYKPLALLCEQKHITGDAATIIGRSGDIPVYTGTRELLATLTGYTLTRGVLCAMRRPTPLSLEEVLPGSPAYRSDRRRGRYNQHRSNLPFGCRSRHRCRAAHPHLLRPAQPACGQGIHGVGIPRTMDLVGRSHRQTERLRFPHGSYGAYRQLHTYRQSCLDRRT